MKSLLGSNKKLTITIVALLIAMLALLSALIGVLSAGSLSLNAGYMIGFEVGNHVAAKVKMSYIVGDTTYVPNVYANNQGLWDQDEDGYVTINTTTNIAAGEVVPDAVTLSKDNPTLTVIFEVQDILTHTDPDIINNGVRVAVSVSSNNNALQYFDIEYWEKGHTYDERMEEPIETDSDGYSRYATTASSLIATEEYTETIFWKVVLSLKDFNSEIDAACVDIVVNLTSVA